MKALITLWVLMPSQEALIGLIGLQRLTKLPKEEVESIVNDLFTQRLVVKVEKKGFFKKKVNLGVTEIGLRLLNAKKQELEKKDSRCNSHLIMVTVTQLQSYMDANRMWIPLMLFSGIMDVIFFTSMMSFMGMGMNPIESALTSPDSATQDTGTNSGDVQQVDDQGGSADTAVMGQVGEVVIILMVRRNSGGFDTGGFDGFDGGGFE